MATLTETAYYTRKTIRYGAIGLVVLIIAKGIISAAIAYWRKLHPPAPPPPTVAFGKLPKIKFPEQKFEPTKIVYRLETVTGGTPNLGNIGKVYFMPIKRVSLLALNRAKIQAKRMGFSGEAKKVSETVFQWQNPGLPLTTLEMDISNGNFAIKKNWQEDQSLLGEDKRLPVKDQAIIETKNFLQNNGLLSDDLQTGKAEVSYLSFTPPDLIPVISLSEADFARVDLFRSNLDNLPILPPDPKKALVSFLFSGLRREEKRILEIEYTHFPISKETYATYPLKTSAQAWEELKTGAGFVAHLPKDKSEITIRKIYLAYFENNLPQNYLQPIYVFEGDNGFTAYVPAISPEWVE